MSEIFECPFCGRNNFKNKSGFTQHIKHCKMNPDKVDVSDETKRKMSENQKISQNRPDVKQKKSEALKISQNRPDVKQKISEGGKKRFEDPEERRKTGEASKRSWEDTERREKQSETQKKRWEDTERREKQSETQKKRYEDPEERKKISDTLKKRCEDPEVRHKMSETAKKPEVQQKIYETKKKNNSFNTSKIEEQLKNYFDSNNIEYIYQYKNNLYPFNCDFYLPKYDMYIEIQGSWTHGFKPYDSEDEECQERLELWKSKNTDYYNNAINVWTIRDVKKRETAKINNLNWIEIFSKDLNECINIIQKHI